MSAPADRPGPLVGYEEIMIDTVTPQWSKKVRDRASKEKMKDSYVVNPLTFTRYTCITGGTSGRTSLIKPVACSNGTQPPVTGQSWLDGDAFSYLMRLEFADVSGLIVVSPPQYTDAEVDEVIAEACTGVTAAVRAGESACLEDLAELHQTYQMLRHPLQSTAQFIGSLKSIPWKRWKPPPSVWKWYYQRIRRGGNALFQYGSTMWLTYRYGARPLMHSLQSLVSALTTERRSDITTARAQARRKRERTEDIVRTVGKFKYTVRRHTVEEIRVRAFSVDQYKASFSTDLGLLPDQIPVTLWNLITCSFVVDWFLNIGDYINALVPRAGVSNLASGYTVERTVIDTYQMTTCVIADAWKDTYKLDKGITGTMVVSQLRKTRVPGLKDPKLLLKADFGFSKDTRVADAVALLYQKVGQLIKTLR